MRDWKGRRPQEVYLYSRGALLGGMFGLIVLTAGEL